MKTLLRTGMAIAICWTSIGLESTALAQSLPSSLAGTWQGFSNQSAVTINISQPASSLNCQSISGSMTPSDYISGFYCPGSGRVTFMRTRNSVAIQFYAGNLSTTGTTLRMTGTFFVVPGTSGGIPGEYSFYVTKP